MPTHEADIIIVGGGTAGLVLASRLSANPSLEILVIEAGNDTTSDPRTQIPALWYGLLDTENEWGFNITPQAALGGKAFRQPQGRQLGGCSGLNVGVFIANSAANVDAWGALGNEGWDWETLGPYYRKVFRMTLPRDPKKVKELGLEYVDVDENGVSGSVDGPIQASFPDAVDDPSAGAWVRTLRGLGYAMSGDPFSGEPMLGGYINALATDPVTKTRSYSANAYYVPVKDRPNLRVVTGAQVTRVIFESSSPDAEPTATGVEYVLTGGETHTAKARSEVILSAGAINTPKLLELSGIGSSAILNQFGIPVRVDNPHVGENLQDHAMAGVSFEVKDSYKSTLDDLSRQVPEALETAMREYQTNRTGPFTVGGFCSSALMSLAEFADLEPDGTEGSRILALTELVQDKVGDDEQGWL
jgi:choline dehydrogenase-like flavoprotein